MSDAMRALEALGWAGAVLLAWFVGRHLLGIAP